MIVIVVAAGSVLGQRPIVPVCPKPTDAEKLIGFEIKLLVPKNTSVAQGHDVDYEYWSIDLGRGKTGFRLSGFSGPNVGNGEPDREDTAGSRKTTHRYWTHNKRRGADSSGTFKNGKRWRNFGLFGEVIWYHNVSADAAAYFDQLLQTACFLD